MSKKLIVLALALCLVMGTFAMASAETMGTGVYTTATKVESAYELDGDLYDGAIELESTVCTVVLDGNVIKSIRFDMTQAKFALNAKGEVIKGATGDVFASKVELKEAYGMVAYANAPAGEWYVQAKAFEDYCVGKTVEEVLGLELNEAGKLVDADVYTSCSIIVTSFMQSLQLAVANAR